MFKKIISSCFVFLYLFSPFITNAQSASVVREDIVPLDMKINNVSYSVEKRIISIDFSVENKSNSFVDNLKYSFELYKGDKLEDKGLLFRNLDYIVSTVDKFERLSPGEVRRQTIQYTPPETIDGGNYFIRATVFNEELSVYGITYTKEPIKLTGRGGFISNVVAALVDGEKIYGVMEGPTLEKDKTYKIAFPKTANEQLFKYLETSKVYVDIKISHINSPDKYIFDNRNLILNDFLREDSKGIEIPIAPWENMQSGSHTVFVSFKNEKGEQLTESILIRLLYRGLLGRIYESQTNINSYKRGQPLDLVANIVVAGDENADKVNLKAIFRNSEGDSQEFSKQIVLNKTFQGIDEDVNFRDFKSKKMLVEEVELILSDQNGKILDTQIITLDPNKIFEYPKDFTWVKNTIITLLILILIILVLAFLKKKFNLNILASLIAVILISGSFVVGLDKSYFVLAQTGDSNDYGVCTDPFASNYNQPLPCDYSPQGYCNDVTAINYGELGECTYDNGQYGCIDVNASNYDPNATIDDGSCQYEDGRSGKPRLIGDLLDIWSNPNGVPNGLQEICEDDCIDTEYYVKLQCKQCGNQGLDMTVDYYNNWTGDNTEPTGQNDLTYTVNTASEEYLFDFSYYTVSEDDLLQKQSENLAINDKLKQAPNSNLAGIPTSANDVINQWIYGPFNFPFCFEYKDEQGNFQETENNIYSQSSNVQATTQFGGDYCQLSFEEGSSEDQAIEQSGYFNGVSNEIRDLLCELPGNIQGSFFLDSNEDGVRSMDEPYIKSQFAGDTCSGETYSILGRIVSYDGIMDFTSLSPSNCSDDLKPYFEKTELLPGQYVPSLDLSSSSGWVQTGLQYLNGSVWETVESIFVRVNETAKVNIGIKNSNDAIFTCAAEPEYSLDFPLDVDWYIDEFYSDIYDISELTFVWGNETGTNSNTTVSGGNSNGLFSTTYNQNTGGEKIYNVSVYARNNQGEVVSNTANCLVGAGVWNGEVEASCLAYTALNSNSPKLFFGPGEQVYWKATVDGGTNPYVYTWTGDASGNNQNSGPYDVITGGTVSGEYSYQDGPIYTANVLVRDDNGVSANASCSISIKQCVTDLDCADLGFPSGYICNNQTFTCVFPPPVFITPLSLDPGIVNEGEQCGLSWTVSSADSCMVYKNGQIYLSEESSSATIDVDPGTYVVRCENSTTNESVTAGPVRCLVNPEIREE